MKLLASVSKGSIALFFFILMWRAVHHYELADLAFKGSTRLFMVLPPVILFLGNMAGCVGSLMSNGALGKKRMKAILNLNKLMEIALMAYNVSRLVLVPSKLVVREGKLYRMNASPTRLLLDHLVALRRQCELTISIFF